MFKHFEKVKRVYNEYIDLEFIQFMTNVSKNTSLRLFGSNMFYSLGDGKRVNLMVISRSGIKY